MIRRFVGRGGQPRDPHAEDESGQGLAEYGLILALIAVVCVAGLTSLGQAIAASAGFTSLPISL
jgi:pilus assembly protein Flp/PilA